MTELVSQRRARQDDPTAPFSLERASSRPPALDTLEASDATSDAVPTEPAHDAHDTHDTHDTHGALAHDEVADAARDEHDGVVHLVSRRSDPSADPTDAPGDRTHVGDDATPDAPEAAAELRTSRPIDARRLDRPGRRAVRLLTVALGADALVLLSLAFASLGRLRHEAAGAPDLLVGLVALALALPCLLGAASLFRIGRRDATPTTDAHRFAQGIGHLRAIFVIKATVLFTTLGLGCFVFSLVASLLAVL